jgi:two-component system, sensor histidine kinase LadS
LTIGWPVTGAEPTPECPTDDAREWRLVAARRPIAQPYATTADLKSVFKTRRVIIGSRNLSLIESLEKHERVNEMLHLRSIFASGLKSLLRAALTLLTCWLCSIAPALASTPIVVDANLDGLSLFGHADFLRDPANHELPQQLGTSAWQPLSSTDRYLPPTTDTVWLRLELRNPGTTARRWVIACDYVWIHEMNVFVTDGRGMRRHAVGGGVPFSAREILAPRPAVGDEIAAGATQVVFMHLRNFHPDSINLVLRAYDQSHFYTAMQDYMGVHGVYAGIFLGLCAIWLVLGVSLREPSYFSYAGYLFFSMLAWIGSRGFLFRYVTFDYPYWNIEGGFVIACGMAFFSFLFARQSLRLRSVSPRLDRVGLVLMLFSAAIAISGLLGLLDFDRLNRLTRLAIALMSVNAFFAFVSWRRGTPHVGWLAVGWLLYGLTLIMSMCLATFGSSSPLVEDLIGFNQWATLVETFCFTLSLAQWVRIQQQQRAIAERVANIDGLTGLENRRRTEERLRHLMRQPPTDGRRWLAVVDLDLFKKINDTYGHAAGDAVLQRFAEQLCTGARSDDVCGRFGGEEFVIAYDGINQGAAMQAANRLRLAFEAKPTVHNGQSITHTLSIGLAEAKVEDDLRSWFQRADAALYQAKQEGRNRVCVFSFSPSPTTVPIDSEVSQ